MLLVLNTIKQVQMQTRSIGSLSRWVCHMYKGAPQNLGRSNFYFSNIFKQLLTLHAVDSIYDVDPLMLLVEHNRAYPMQSGILVLYLDGFVTCTRVPLKKLGRSHFYLSNIFKQLLTPSNC